MRAAPVEPVEPAIEAAATAAGEEAATAEATEAAGGTAAVAVGAAATAEGQTRCRRRAASAIDPLIDG